MIKATATSPDGPVLLLGLSGENVARLFADEPILIDTTELGLPPMKIVIVAGKTNAEIMKTVSRHVAIRGERNDVGHNLQ